MRLTLEAGWLAPAGPAPAAFEAAVADATGFLHVARHRLRHRGAASRLPRARRAAGRRGLGADRHLRRHHRARGADGRGAALPRRRPAPASRSTPGCCAEGLARAARRGRLPRVVVPVDLYGQCCDLDAIVAACDRWGVPVLCDSAAAMGATGRGGRHAGRGARLAAFSSTATRSSPTGGGGALACDDPALLGARAALAARRGSPPRTTSTRRRAMPTGCPPLLAAVGLAQLPTLAARVARRREIFAPMPRRLGDLPGLSFMPEPGWGRANRWLTVALVDPADFGADRETLRRALDAAGRGKPPGLEAAAPAAGLPRRALAPAARRRAGCSSAGSACPRAAG